MANRKVNVNWDDQPLGKESDSSISRRLGCSHSTVRIARMKRNIPAFNVADVVDWENVGLGDRSDAEIAREIGVGISRVSSERRARGIATNRYKMGIRSGRTGVDWDNQPLGDISDIELARKLGVSTARVAEKRREKGIGKHVGKRPAWARRGVNWRNKNKCLLIVSGVGKAMSYYCCDTGGSCRYFWGKEGSRCMSAGIAGKFNQLPVCMNAHARAEMVGMINEEIEDATRLGKRNEELERQASEYKALLIECRGVIQKYDDLHTKAFNRMEEWFNDVFDEEDGDDNSL